jgi:hypothetical protein
LKTLATAAIVGLVLAGCASNAAPRDQRGHDLHRAEVFDLKTLTDGLKLMRHQPCPSPAPDSDLACAVQLSEEILSARHIVIGSSADDIG